MSIPIRSAKKTTESQFQTVDKNDLSNIFDILNIPSNSRWKESLYNVWSKSKSIGGDRVQVSKSTSPLDVSKLVSRGYLRKTDDSNVYEISSDAKSVIKESILESEYSFTKEASKQLVAKNSYDFGKEVLVKISDPKQVGAKYITIDKKVFARKNLKPITIAEYNIQTRKDDGSLKDLKDYTDKELVHVLHLAKRIVKNASSIAEKETSYVPVNRIKSFSQIIMKELNSKRG